MLPFSFRDKRNVDGFTPTQEFTKHHQYLVDEGEKIMKGTRAQLMVVATLLATITFAASIVNILSLLSSRYAQHDFLKSLPNKWMISVLTIYLFTVNMIGAFVSNLDILFGRRSPVLSNFLGYIAFSILCYTVIPMLYIMVPFLRNEDFFKSRIIEARFEIIAKEDKEHIVEKKIDVILPLQGEFGSPEVKGSLDVDDVSSAIDGVFNIVLGVGEDDDLCNAAMDGGDDTVESGDISILNSLIGHDSPRSLQLCGTIGTTEVLIDKEVDKEVPYNVYTLHVLIPFLKRLNDQYIKKKKMKAAMQRR
ncbi:hypothetical protein Tco_1308972 [Tanacetum coccineum]